MLQRRLNLVRSLILLHIKKNLKLVENCNKKYLKTFINLLIFTVILLAFKKFETQKKKKSDEILTKPKIFWKLIDYRTINLGVYLTLNFLHDHSNVSEFFGIVLKKWIRSQKNKRINKLIKSSTNFYTEFLKKVYQINQILIYEIKNTSKKVIDIVKYVDELKEILTLHFTYSSNYIVYVYFINLDLNKNLV